MEARTDDDVTLRLRHLPARGSSRGAVVLLHGLSSNDAVFCVPERSLAQHLSDLGLDVVVANLRGAGISDHPRRPWGLDEYVTQDLPAILRSAREVTGRDELFWVGHSMGGILLFFHAMENPGDTPITRAVSVGSSIDYTTGKSSYADLKKLLPLAGMLDFVPVGALMRANASIAGAGPRIGLESMNFFRPNIDKQVLRHMMRTGFHRVPVPVFRGLATTFSEHGFSRSGGDLRYLELTDSYRLPTLFVGGDADPQAPPESVERTAELLGGHPESRTLIVGASRGQERGYGHFDLLVGDRAQSEVWPHLADFLLEPPK